jgi:hypothetical protein
VPVNSLAFSPDGSTLAIGAGAGFNSKVNTGTGRAKTSGEFKLWKLQTSLQPEAKPKKEKDQKDDTAWGKAIGGLQAGLALRPDAKRVYHHGETITVVVKVRNVSKETVKFEYLQQYLDENPPVVTGADGMTILQARPAVLGFHVPVEVSLEPGQEIVLETRMHGASGRPFELRPAGGGGKPTTKTWPLFVGTGMVRLQYERVFGNTSSGEIKLNPMLSKLGTGTLDLEIHPEPPAASEKK